MYFRFPVKQLIRAVLALSLASVLSGLSSSPLAQAQELTQTKLDRFDMLTATSGWILLDTHLFWTSDAGQSWEEITPVISSDGMIQAVQFTDMSTGWLLWTRVDSSGSSSFYIAHTIDRGNTWTSRSLALFEPGEIGSYAEKAEMGWFDMQTGWISVKQMSGSNFSLGALFTTSDGGGSWSRFVLPVADRIHFSDPKIGWAVGGPAGGEIFQTQDGGATWTDSRPSDIPNGTQSSIAYTPFVVEGRGVLAITTLGTENYLNLYSLQNSDQWLALDRVRLESPSSTIGLSILDPQNFVGTIPGTPSIVRMRDGEVEVLRNQDGLSASIVQLDMVSIEDGWAKSIDSNCIGKSCASSTNLLTTTDGGVTWQRINLPIVHSDVIFSPAPSIPNTSASMEKAVVGNTEVYLGQGFDKCEIPSLAQMRTWWDASPYQAVNLYIGGSSRACANSALTSSYISQLYQQGWKFIPTWVGPQAPCIGYPSRMSSDVTVAFGQGVSEANLAVERLAALGLTDPDKTGSVVYYDIEPYGTNTACRAAVNAFMNGWVSQMHVRGNMAGVYGSTQCDTSLSDFRNITYVPDVIWPARWYHNLGSGYYDPTADVWNLGSCIPNTAWSNHQRIRQYEGDHDELWGGLILGIDSNVLDGVVAIPDTTPVEVNIGANTQGTYQFVPHHIRHESYAGINNGPIQIVSPNNALLVAAERVIYKVNGVNTSFTEMMALPNNQLDNTYWLPWYNNVDLDTQLRFANVSGTTATLHVLIGGQEMQGSPFTLLAGQSTRKSFADINNGPVKIHSSQNIVAAERLIYKVDGLNTSFTEMMALPDSQLDATYWLPWYNNVDLDTQLRFANVADQTATVHVYVAGQEMQGSPVTLAPADSTRISFPGVNNGPVQIVSNHGVPIVAAERVIYRVNGLPTSLTELMALPDIQLDATYWLPWYNSTEVDTQLRFANVSGSPATVHVFIGGQEMTGSPFSLAPAASTRRSFPGINSGPVKIVSNVPIVAAQRLIYRVNGVNTSFSETMALPDSELDTSYWLPWYNNVDLDTQLRFGVP
jgi:photosystem II stability/assembly factor-like uncharacterized protein